MATHLPVVRSASLNGYVELAQSLGLDAAAMLRRAGLQLRSLSDPETPISTQAVRRLLETSALASGAEDFGLRLAARRSLSNLGPLSLVLKEEPSARAALDTLCRYLRLLNASLLTELEEHDGLLRISEDLVTEPGAPLQQSMQLAVGVMHRILHELLGERWQPLWVGLRQAPPQEPTRFERFFGTRVVYLAGFNGIVCRASDLTQGLAAHQTAMASFARRYLDGELSRGQRNAQTTTRQLITALLPGGRCTAQQVAQHLGVDRRTLHRHLSAEQTDFSAVLQAVRMEMAEQQLRQNQRSLAEVATLLGFSSPSAFAYWFRQGFGCSARAWRQGRP
ncbi:AraC family transcriptional regulator [Hydrogenophaga atypica]|uniref:AraC family transcriptional regulator n=1 Tax=Hydrogenophaga atypica TaxID=249409 RepID=A0ABW2QQL4_9BURK